ncbi:MAG: right-handed parallel beta-helix repeat-containing protein [Rhodanobacteraceae bacterium]
MQRKDVTRVGARYARWAGWSLAALLLAATRAEAGGALEVCVANDSQFAAAALNATILPTTIKLVQGTYRFANTTFDFFNPNGCGGDPQCSRIFQNGLQLLGGYAANCASRQIDAGNTVITADTQSDFHIETHGDVTVEGITFDGISGGVGIRWYDYYGDVQNAVNAIVRRNTVVGNSYVGGIALGWLPGGDQTLSARLVNNLVYGNAPAGDGFCTVELFADQGTDATFDLINNTIVDNANGAGDGVCLGSGADDGGSLLAYNNILYGNAGRDLVTYGGTTALLIDNVIGTHSYQGVVTASGTLTGNPQLDGSYRPIESPASPVINSGSNDVPGGLPTHDLDGGPRVVGTTVDRGAYESTINDAFLQTVTNANDSGNGSLRAAITSANANGANGALISFDIGSGCGPQVITLTSPLPDITAPVIINGFTQPGASPNDLDTGNDATICVILDAGSSGNPPDHAIGTASNAPADTEVTIKGLAFSAFPGAAIDLQGGGGHEIAGNHFGGSVSGYGLGSNGTNIRLGIATHDVIIGGDDVANRNLIGGAFGDGIVLQGGGSGPTALGSYNDQVLNNYIGIGWSQGVYIQRSNGGQGIHLLGHDNTLSGNLIGTNTGSGVLLDGGAAAGNLLDGNFIGADQSGVSFGNFARGIHFIGETGAAPYDNTVRNNIIANNGRAGIWVQIGQHNKLRKNAIYDNAALGIDIAGGGVTPNDDDGSLQLDDYGNRGQNFPVLTSAAGGATNGRVVGTLTTTPGDYTVDFFVSAGCDGSGYGEGQIWLKGATVTVPQPQVGDQGTANFAIAITAPVPLTTGEAMTATATDTAGDTSEFSACTSYINDSIFANGFDPPPA